LHALRTLQVLDTSHEERFDRVTRMAKRMFGVSISLVSLVDENRQWFKSKQGLEATETPRKISFCGHAINQEGLFMVPDALEDERFSDNPLVTGAPYIRFYAGYTLKLRQGINLGT
jgi:GAF domain-containing protein